MDIENFIQIVTNNPIYLSIAVILSLIIAYSFLKKLFKMLLVALSLLVLYVTFLAISGIEHEEAKEKGSKAIEDAVEFGKKFVRDKENEGANNK